MKSNILLVLLMIFVLLVLLKLGVNDAFHFESIAAGALVFALSLITKSLFVSRLLRPDALNGSMAGILIAFSSNVFVLGGVIWFCLAKLKLSPILFLGGLVGGLAAFSVVFFMNPHQKKLKQLVQ